jgi:hypothetical protein
MSNDQGPLPEKFSDDLKPFEAILGSLWPVASRIDRDRLMYEAGAAAVSIPATAPKHRLKQWMWACASAGFAKPAGRANRLHHPALGHRA